MYSNIWICMYRPKCALSGWVRFWCWSQRLSRIHFCFFFPKSVNDKIIVIYLKLHLDFLFVFAFDMIGFSLKFACYFHIPFLKNWFYIYYSLGFYTYGLQFVHLPAQISAELANSSHSSYDRYINETFTKNYKTVIVNYFTFRSYKKLKAWYSSLISCRTVTTPPSSGFMTIIVLQVISF